MAYILIVEDNEMNRDMLGRRLERRGFEIEFALDGQEGLDKMRERKPDLVLMDMGLPVLDGWQATTQAKEDPDLKDIPIIALTAHALETDRQKALAAGASAVMMGGMFAGTEEAPGEVFLYQGRSYKSYRGMGSIGAMQEGAADRYFQDPESNADKLVPEGIEGRVPYKGSVVAIIYQLCGGLRASMGYCGCADIEQMRSNSQFVEITAAGIRESHVHDVQITKEAPNYHAE